MKYATGMTEQEAIKSGKSCTFSKAHGLWFADGETPQPIPAPEAAAKVQESQPVSVAATPEPAPEIIQEPLAEDAPKPTPFKTGKSK